MARCLVFMSDYGRSDPCVGIVHAVIRQIDAEIPIVDLTHSIAPQDVRAGAIALADAIPFLPRRAVVLAVVDPGVGGARRAVAVHTREGFSFIGPDNGLLAPAIALTGGPETVYELTSSQWRLEPVSRTFHGRDLFAPVAARLASGGSLTVAGQPIDPSVLMGVQLPQPSVAAGRIEAEVLEVDVYGNVRLAASPIELQAAGIAGVKQVEIDAAGMRMPVRLVGAFEEVAPNEPMLYEDSNGSLAIAVNGGNAAEQLGITRGAIVTVLGEPLTSGEPPRGVIAAGEATPAVAASQPPPVGSGAPVAPPEQSSPPAPPPAPPA
ncbi:MAG: SAM-dependent chlorinase/fluorinase [Actinobacteria bacterium]|nr:SAM-dependent chlorinase/fluorinase [Actinomycetota bacterium]